MASANKKTVVANKVTKMKVKKGDKVIVIAGKDKGKTGEVLKAIPAKNRVIVQGVETTNVTVELFRHDHPQSNQFGW